MKNTFHNANEAYEALLNEAITEARWTITIENNGVTHQDPNSYTKGLIWEKIYEYYKYYYNKYEK